MRKTLVRSILTICTILSLVGTASAEPAVPFHGRAWGAITGLTPAALGVTLDVSATGAATRIGAFTRQESLVLDPVSNTFAGLIRFTTANGDTLLGQVTGAFVAPGTATGRYRFTGGTGRFATASGKATFSLSSPDGVNFRVEFKGHLTGLAE